MSKTSKAIQIDSADISARYEKSSTGFKLCLHGAGCVFIHKINMRGCSCSSMDVDVEISEALAGAIYMELDKVFGLPLFSSNNSGGENGSLHKDSSE